jgi:hypothetical protein
LSIPSERGAPGCAFGDFDATVVEVAKAYARLDPIPPAVLAQLRGKGKIGHTAQGHDEWFIELEADSIVVVWLGR